MADETRNQDEHEHAFAASFTPQVIADLESRTGENIIVINPMDFDPTFYLQSGLLNDLMNPAQIKTEHLEAYKSAIEAQTSPEFVASLDDNDLRKDIKHMLLSGPKVESLDSDLGTAKIISTGLMDPDMSAKDLFAVLLEHKASRWEITDLLGDLKNDYSSLIAGSHEEWNEYIREHEVLHFDDETHDHDNLTLSEDALHKIKLLLDEVQSDNGSLEPSEGFGVTQGMHSTRAILSAHDVTHSTGPFMDVNGTGSTLDTAILEAALQYEDKMVEAVASHQNITIEQAEEAYAKNEEAFLGHVKEAAAAGHIETDNPYITDMINRHLQRGDDYFSYGSGSPDHHVVTNEAQLIVRAIEEHQDKIMEAFRPPAPIQVGFHFDNEDTKDPQIDHVSSSAEENLAFLKEKIESGHFKDDSNPYSEAFIQDFAKAFENMLEYNELHQSISNDPDLISQIENSFSDLDQHDPQEQSAEISTVPKLGNS